MKIYKRLLVIAFIIFTAGLVGCSFGTAELNIEPKIQSGKDITFFVATDTHYLSKDLTDNGEAFKQYIASGDGKQLDYIDEIMDAFTNDIKKEKPNILIINGDLTNNGEMKSHLDFAKKLKAIEKIGTSVYVIPGNHDIQNPWARGFSGDKQYVVDSITAKDFSKIYGGFGYNEAISRDKKSLSYLAAPSKDIWLLMLDTAKYKENELIGVPQPDGELSAETLTWIKKCSELAKEHNAKIVTVMHHNLLDHTQGKLEGFTLNNSKDAIQVFENSELDLTLSGHIHRQDIKSYNNGRNSIYEIVTSALSVYPQQYGVLKYSPSNGFDYNTSRVDVESWAKEVNSIDKNLINFKDYSQKLMGDRVYGMAYNHLLSIDGYTDEQMILMAKTIEMINLKSLGASISTKDIMDSPGFKLLAESKDSSLQHYAKSISSNTIDNSKLHIPNKPK